MDSPSALDLPANLCRVPRCADSRGSILRPLFTAAKAFVPRPRKTGRGGFASDLSGKTPAPRWPRARALWKKGWVTYLEKWLKLSIEVFSLTCDPLLKLSLFADVDNAIFAVSVQRAAKLLQLNRTHP